MGHGGTNQRPQDVVRLLWDLVKLSSDYPTHQGFVGETCWDLSGTAYFSEILDLSGMIWTVVHGGTYRKLQDIVRLFAIVGHSETFQGL